MFVLFVCFKVLPIYFLPFVGVVTEIRVSFWLRMYLGKVEFMGERQRFFKNNTPTDDKNLIIVGLLSGT